MKRLLLGVLFCLQLSSFFAQDTTWVTTFTFDSITTRRANFQFPIELNNKRFEKVLMYYKLKCSTLTTWDSYNCGEWDYLTYTRVIDHTNVFDSSEVLSKHYKVNTDEPLTYNYNLTPSFDTNQVYRYTRSLTTSNDFNVLTSGSETLDLFKTNHTGGVFQYLITASELINAGIVAGDISNLSLDFLQSGNNLSNFEIKLKETSLTELTTIESIGFSSVYSKPMNGVLLGQNDFVFHTPFAWDGLSNVIIELNFSNPTNGTMDYQVAATDAGASNLSVNYDGNNGVFVTGASDYAELDISNDDFSGDVTISFWANGLGSAGQNTSVLEAVDSLGNRVLNIHFPWSDNVVYFDGGEGSSYDRISKAISPSIIDGSWHHWSFVKKVSTGQMLIYLDGILWHSGSGLTKPIGRVARFNLGGNANMNYVYSGKLDEFSIFNAALDATTISDWKNKKINATHPNFNTLFVYYDFDDEQIIRDRSMNNRLGMPMSSDMIQLDQSISYGFESSSLRPNTIFGQGTLGDLDSILVNSLTSSIPEVIFEYAATDNSFQIVNTSVAYPEAMSYTYDYLGNELNATSISLTEFFTNSDIVYYEEPFELVNDVEIGRYITPYGINFDLGSAGFSWVYDVTDYQQYLHDVVDLAAHNTQELLELRFAFIEGVPPRDVHHREPIWADYKSYNYGNLANDLELAPIVVSLSDTSEMFKVKTRFTGHGHNGNGNCCEWVPKTHQIKVDGVERFSWSIWQDSECANNPNIGQGGTWPYAREGWCPGDMVKEFEHELTPFVTSGSDVELDYAITDIPGNDPDQAGGNYVAALDLISYSAPNFQNDAAIIDVLNPNSYEYYSKWNPACSDPRIIIQNTGAQNLTSCVIRCWVTYGVWLEYSWSGDLAFLEKELVEIPVTDLSWWSDFTGNGIFTAQIYNLNGSPDLDEYPHNNVKSTRFEAAESVSGAFLIYCKTNNKANENKYRIEDQNGNIVFERSSLQNSTTYIDTFNLENGCYRIILEDSDDDGIGFWYSNQVEGETYGQFRVRKVGGAYLETFPTDFGRYHRYDLTVGFDMGTNNQLLDHTIEVFPNPTEGAMRVELSGAVAGNAELVIVDIMGRKIYSESMEASNDFAFSDLQLEGLESGTYIIRVTTQSRVYTKEFIKQ
jgi:hypothetical protein